MPRAQLALNVPDLEASITFYSKLFGVEPAKRRAGEANFAILNPPLKLVLIEGEPRQSTRLDHLGIEVETTEDAAAAAGRLKDVDLATFEENDTSCCYALPGSSPISRQQYCLLTTALTVLDSSAWKEHERCCCRRRT